MRGERAVFLDFTSGRKQIWQTQTLNSANPHLQSTDSFAGPLRRNKGWGSVRSQGPWARTFRNGWPHVTGEALTRRSEDPAEARQVAGGRWQVADSILRAVMVPPPAPLSSLHPPRVNRDSPCTPTAARPRTASSLRAVRLVNSTRV